MKAVVDAIVEGVAQHGVLPIENSTFGTVIETYDALRNPAIGKDIFILKEHILSIKHCLLVSKGTSLADVTAVYSHPQVSAHLHSIIRVYIWLW